MMIIGVDYHPNFRAIAFFVEETAECGEQEPGKWTEAVAISDNWPSDTDYFKLARNPTTVTH
jgi:hypothetical protein